MRFSTLIICLLLGSMLVYGQEYSPRYYLSPGEQYFLEQEFYQTARTEEEQLIGNVNLDLRSMLELEVISVNSNGAYLLTGKYSGLEIDFFAPQSDISISSSSSAFSPIKNLLRNLEGKEFNILMSEYGEFLGISDLDSIINTLTFTGEEHQLRGEVLPEHGHLALIKNTIHDAFGSDALINTANIALYLYDDVSLPKAVKETDILFNGKPVSITNNLYFNALNEQDLRVQGVGVIKETATTIELNDYVLVTSLKGNQTYDYLCDLKTGWIREGISKQKIHSLSGLRNHDELPDGLKIPSVSETEYIFRGGRIKH